MCHCLEQAVPEQWVTSSTACSKQWHTVGRSSDVVGNADWEATPVADSLFAIGNWSCLLQKKALRHVGPAVELPIQHLSARWTGSSTADPA
jgi:hypothetical protein